ncbi:MAG: hypothetical protein OEU90_00350 [Gammaproteobacteria bacterium]|nr:hypothetical protein [Gammaproteobacteria bacterium]MDH3750150.1 hypothetical protein [Gammaproteobacteria bacterium]MDH3803897.1 hypothetical protein [Gammaproteobacteria bacterium]
MHKALIPFLALATIVPLLLAPPTSRADAAEVAPPADDETLIYVIREGRMLGAAVGHWIAINDKTVARLKSDKHAVIRAKAGLITLNLANSGVPVFSVAIDDRPGETVYLKWRLGDREMTELDEAAAAKFLRKTKPMDPIEAPSPNAEEILVLINLSRLGFDLMQPASKAIAPDDEHGVITIFRRKEADKIDLGVWNEHGFVGTLGANEAVSIAVPPGTHFFLAGNVGTTLLKAEVAAGKRYYAWLDYGKMLGRVRLTPVSSSQSGELQGWLKKTKQVELIPQAVTNRIREREEIVTDFLRLAIERANSGAADFTLLGSDDAHLH